ncbi:MAG: hypothetical protein CM15mP29_3620 [Alphaproteobacteria bacterium]|nr:MAG: hypothetical protein CM15mP29_3620 [Alphaproteobacteria bacterium]
MMLLSLTSVLDAPANIGPIQIGPSECTSIKSIAEYLIEIVDRDIEIKYDLTKPIGNKGRCAVHNNKFLDGVLQ